MPFLYTFCSWFSVRTGSIIVGVISSIQAIIFLLFGVIGLQNSEIISYVVDTMMEENDMLFTKPFFVYFQENTEHVFMVFMVTQVVYIGLCLLLIHGSFKLNISEILPYTVSEFLRLVILSGFCTTLMLLIKKNVLDFNVLIACLVTGGFALLFLYYLWLCPVSLIQCIIRVNSKKESTPTSQFNNDKNQLSFYYDYLSDFKFKPMMPNRDYYQYQYGNLPRLHF